MNIDKIIDLLNKVGVEFLKDAPMKNYTTFRIGGPADLLITTKTTNELRSILEILRSEDMPWMLLGNGSNLLVRDEGLKMAMIRLSGDFKGVELNENTVTCGAGVTLSKLCTFAHSNALSGLEFAFGIPGTVGGAVYMNAGAYGGEMKDVLLDVTYLTESGEICTKRAEELSLSYRHSLFKETGDIILFASFKLSKDCKEDIKARMDDFMNRRVTKQPLEYPSAGSVFKRPEGAFAGALIEQCNFKGYSIGGAQVSEKHSGFIVNRGEATCSDVLSLISEIQETVREKTGFELEREIILI